MSAEYHIDLSPSYEIKASNGRMMERKPHQRSRYVCEYCLKVFYNSMNLKTHKYQHTGDRPYSCSMCDYAAKNLTNFQNHVRAKHTKERPYRCEHCDKCFTEYKTWRSHEDTHTTSQMYACTLCDRAYKHRTTLLGHLRHKHRPGNAAEVRQSAATVVRKPAAHRKLAAERVKAAPPRGRRLRVAADAEQISPLVPGATATAMVAIGGPAAAAFDGAHGEESVDTDLLLGTLPEFTESEQNELLALMRHDSGDQGSIDVAMPMLDPGVKIETMVESGASSAWLQQNSSPSGTSGCLLATPTVSPKPEKTVVIYPTSLKAEPGFGDWLLLVPVTASTAAARPVTILNSLAPP